MKRLIVFVFLAFLATPHHGLGQASPADLLHESKTLNQKALSLYRTGKFQETEPLLRRALEIREKSLRPDHPDVTEGLPKASALRQAKLSLMEKRANPFFWGGFVLTGEP